MSAVVGWRRWETPLRIEVSRVSVVLSACRTGPPNKKTTVVLLSFIIFPLASTFCLVLFKHCLFSTRCHTNAHTSQTDILRNGLVTSMKTQEVSRKM